MKINNKNWNKITASFFTCLMIFEAVSGTLNVAAYELGKVKSSSTTGSYYHQSLDDNRSLNNGIKSQNTQQKIQKEPEMDVRNNEVDPNLEIVEKRTINSKTYQLSDGSYISDTYFEPVHKQQGKEFVEIDNTLENISKNRSTPIYENADGLYEFKVQDQTMSITNEKKQTLSIINNSASLNTYNVKENVILYSDVYDNIDMEYRLRGNSIITNFFVNGVTSQENITFSINKGNLKIKEESEVILFLDDKEEVVYTYTKPVMCDTLNNIMATTFSFVENGDEVEITIKLDNDWTNSEDRIYPITMGSKVADETAKINVTSSYNRSLYPNVTSQYYDLFVGYENGVISSLGYPIGITRTYMHVSNLNLGTNKKIVSAELNLVKKLSYQGQWNTIEIGKTSGYVDPSHITWNNKPPVTSISTTDIGASVGIKILDVTSYIQEIYNGKNNTIELKATNESSSYLPNVFLGESSATDRPRITIRYRDDFDVDPNLPVDTFDSEMRIFSILDKGFEAFSFDGIAKPDTQVIFDLVEKGRDEVILSETSKGNVNKYFIDPIYILNHIEGTQNYPKEKINYTTDYIYKTRIPEFDTPYEYKVKVKGSQTTSTKEFRSNSFIKYKVKIGDNLKNIASYYGLDMNGIKIDNNLNKNTIKEDDVLILRFKKTMIR